MTSNAPAPRTLLKPITVTATDTRPPTAPFKSYMIGFVLSVILTAIPFWLV